MGRPVHVRRERIIAIPLDVLWQLVEPVTSLPSWLPIAEGSDLVASERHRRLRWHRADLTITLELESIGPGTRVALESSQTSSGALGAVSLRFVGTRAVARSLDRALDTLASAGG